MLCAKFEGNFFDSFFSYSQKTLGFFCGRGVDVQIQTFK